MSAVMPEQPSNNVAEFFSPGPGERLRAARLSMGYDLAKIASELHLTSPVVEALEADKFEEIGARVFVRGYLRNYARIVGMPVDSILRQFDEKWPDDDVHQNMVRQSPTLPADGGPGRGWVGAMSWLLVIGIIALFLMWWRGYLDEIVPGQVRSSMDDGVSVSEASVDGDRGFALSGDSVGSADGSLRLPAPPGDLPVDEGEASTESAFAAVVEADSPPVAESPIGEGRLALPPATTTATSPAVIEPSLPAPVPAQPAVAASALSLPTPVEPLAQTTAPASSPATDVASSPADGGAPVVEGNQQIVMNFSGACWVDVRDSERRFKLFGEMPKGARKVLGGKPPYKLVIGNAKVVKITVNGKPFDLMPFAKGNVARFTLDP